MRRSLTENINCAHVVFVGQGSFKQHRAVLNKADVDLEPMMSCNIKEADERMFVHVRNAIVEFSVFWLGIPCPPGFVARVWGREAFEVYTSSQDCQFS